MIKPNALKTWQRKLFTFLFLLSAWTILNVHDVQADTLQQKKKISGTVTDKTGEAIIGASVLEAGTSNGTITDLDGKFELTTADNATLQISYIGYNTESVSLTGKTVLSIVLKDDSKLIEEVVVVGFGTQKKVNLTGAVGTVTAEALEARPVANAVQALQGLVPGLNISTKGNGGELNNSRSMNVRGTGTIGDGSNGDPLVLIDGMEGDLSTINPQDIENISVLKDAAASSIYGSRAPFGVILVTTKSGKEGRPIINYNANFRFNTPVMLPEMQNSWEFVNYFDDANFNGSNTHLYSDDYKKLVKDYFDGKKIQWMLRTLEVEANGIMTIHMLMWIG